MMEISWLQLVLMLIGAGILGMLAGVFLAAVCSAAGRADDLMEGESTS